jgi:seryl-tRNA synthetase
VIEVVKVVAAAVGAVCMAVGLPALLLYAVKERRQNRAADEVAERTVDADVVVKDTAADDARLLHAIAAFDAERVSLQRQRDDAYAEIERQRSEIAYRDRLLEHRDELISELRQRAEDLLERLTEATREVHAVRVQLSELAAESQNEKTRPSKETSL